MLFVNTFTCILGPHHLIMHTCTCYACHLALYMYSQGCVWQPWFSCPDPRDRTLVTLL